MIHVQVSYTHAHRACCVTFPGKSGFALCGLWRGGRERDKRGVNFGIVASEDTTAHACAEDEPPARALLPLLLPVHESA